MGTLFMAAVIACRTANNTILNIIAKTRIRSRSGHYLFAAIASAFALLFVFIWSRGIPEIESADILHGIILGILAIVEEFFLLSALECGSVSMTIICSLMAFGLTRIASVPLWGHTIDLMDVVCVVFAAAAVLILMLDCCNKKIEDAETEGDESHIKNPHYVCEHQEFLHWRKCGLILIAVTALVEIEEKSHSIAAVSENHMGYYFVAFLTGTILAGGLFLWRRIGKKEAAQFTWDWKFILMLIFCGIMKALIYIVIGLAASNLTEELVTIVNSCAVIAIMVIIDLLVFKTKFRWNNYAAAGLAMIAVLAMG